MRLWLLALSLAACAASAQNALWIDLSGEWRMLAGRDRPEFASPDFDDSQWRPFVLPSNQTLPLGSTWLRKTTVLPDGADRTQLALTLGTVNHAYAVYVNGAFAGATGEMTRVEYRIPRPLTFAIPAGAVGADGRFTIAIRSVRFRSVGPLVWGLEPVGPFLVTYRAHAPQEAGAQYIINRKFLRTADAVLAALLLGLAALMLLSWTSERQRSDVLWFAIALAWQGIPDLVRYLLLSENSTPGRWILADYIFSTLSTVSFTVFVGAVMGFRQRWLVPGIWLLWAVFPLSLLVAGERGWFANVSRVLVGVAILLTVVGWWRQGRMRQPVGQHAFAVALLLNLLIRFLNLGFSRGLGLSLVWEVGPFHFRFVQLMMFVLAIPIAWQILRRVKQDGQERQRLAGELQAARIVQHFFRTPAPAHADAVYEPAQEVGGDFFQFFPLSDGGQLIAVGDVSGKGLKAAMVVSLITGALRNRRSDEPAAVLAELNRTLLGGLDSGFVTAIIARCHVNGRVILANAGNPAPYLAGAEVSLEPSLPLGLAPEAEYAERELTIGPDEQLTFVSDGVVEAVDEKGELFGFEHTREMSGRSAKEIAEAAKAWGQNDDITVVTLRRAS
jgi:phosphoserine phosphatase RsbU/P